MTGAYEATRFKAKPTVSQLRSLAVLTPGDAQAAESAIKVAAGMAAGTMLTRWGVAASAQSQEDHTLGWAHWGHRISTAQQLGSQLCREPLARCR